VHALVTGGAGFIGSTLVDRLLREGWQVDVVDNLSTGSLANLEGASQSSAFAFHEIDLTVDTLADLVARVRPDVVFHLAAQMDVRVSVARPMFDATVNILGSLNLLEAACAAGVRKVVFASSGGTIYGETETIPTSEDAAQHPESPYGVAKKSVVDYLYYYRAQRGLEYTALALANVYGPRQDPHGEAGVVAIFAGLLLSGDQAVIFGDGSQTRDFVFVDDVVDAFVRAADRADGMLLNVGTGVETSVRELYEVMAGVTGVTAAPRHDAPRTGELQRNALDAHRATTELGWTPQVSLRDGVARTLEDFHRAQSRNH
jgi:UDP-glucose 4-epimerase